MGTRHRHLDDAFKKEAASEDVAIVGPADNQGGTFVRRWVTDPQAARRGPARPSTHEPQTTAAPHATAGGTPTSTQSSRSSGAAAPAFHLPVHVPAEARDEAPRTPPQLQRRRSRAKRRPARPRRGPHGRSQTGASAVARPQPRPARAGAAGARRARPGAEAHAVATQPGPQPQHTTAAWPGGPPTNKPDVGEAVAAMEAAAPPHARELPHHAIDKTSTAGKPTHRITAAARKESRRSACPPRALP